MALRLLQHLGVCKGCSGGEVARGRTCGGRSAQEGEATGRHQAGQFPPSKVVSSAECEAGEAYRTRRLAVKRWL